MTYNKVNAEEMLLEKGIILNEDGIISIQEIAQNLICSKSPCKWSDKTRSKLGTDYVTLETCMTILKNSRSKAVKELYNKCVEIEA